MPRAALSFAQQTLRMSWVNAVSNALLMQEGWSAAANAGNQWQVEPSAVRQKVARPCAHGGLPHWRKASSVDRLCWCALYIFSHSSVDAATPFRPKLATAPHPPHSNPAHGLARTLMISCFRRQLHWHGSPSQCQLQHKVLVRPLPTELQPEFWQKKPKESAREYSNEEKDRTNKLHLPTQHHVVYGEQRLPPGCDSAASLAH